MTIAARQCREHLVATFPGVRISRNSCRNTAEGGITQHSAFGGPDPYDSNALDIMGGPYGWTRQQNIDLIQKIVDYLEEHLTEWSIRKILWKVHDHFGHAHIDFYPMIEWPSHWCGGPETPIWEKSNGSTFKSRNPQPENGLYDGGNMGYIQDKVTEFDFWTDDNIMDAFDRGRFQDTNRSAFQEYWVTDRADRTDEEKARFMTDYYARL